MTKGGFNPAVDGGRNLTGPRAPKPANPYGGAHPLTQPSASDREARFIGWDDVYKVYSPPNGEDVYFGDMVDCRELMAQGWTSTPPGE
jgi:hypothetical protein